MANPFAPAQPDFSMLANLPNLYQQGLQNAQQRQLQGAFSAGIPMTNGAPDYTAMAKIFAQHGKPEEAVTLLAKAAEARNKAPDFQTIYDPTTGQPQTARWDAATQTLVPIGGAKAKPPKEFNVTDTDKLIEQASSAEQLGGLISSFKPEYSGYVVPQQLELAKQGYPTLNATDKEASDWWDAYNQWVEPVRKGLYGSVLTGPERAAFENARVTPKTDPTVVPKNLAKQQEIMTKAIARRAATLKASGYPPEAVDAALRIESAPAVGGQQQQAVGQPQGPLQAGTVVGGFIYVGGNPNDRNSWRPAQ